MSIDLSQFHQVFIDEAHEHLGNMEQLLLALDVEDASLEDLNAIFRAAHSIKGGSGTFGFSDIAELTHALETLLDKLRKQILDPTDEMISAFLECCDLLNEMLEAHQGGASVDDTTTEAMRSRLLKLADPDLPSKALADEPNTLAIIPNDASAWLIELNPLTDLFAGSASLEALTADLSALGQLTLLSQKPGSCMSWQLKGPNTDAPIRDIFEYICSDKELTINLAETENPSDSEEEDDGFGFFVDESTLPAAQEKAQIEADNGFGFFIDESELPAQQQAEREQQQGFGFFVDEHELPAALNTSAPQNAPVEQVAKSPKVSSKQESAKAPAESSIRVGVEKVDQLINLVGELVITRSMLAQSASHLDPVEFEAIHEGLVNLERNSRDLQEAVMSIRMLPINFVFGRFPRVVRDLTQKMNKKVRLKLVGEETELDKGLIEKLADPLTHLLRNSIDHGIETPEVRTAAGKPEEGTITLSASHQGGSILVQITDDGAGLNREKLLEKAREKNIPLSDNPTDKEVWQLIFAPGFSTAKQVTDVSGRGVGMDVVQRNIAEMKGQVEIESISGEGTTIGLRLPLTLAILDGMTLRVGNEIFIMPLTRILESLQPVHDQLKTVSGKGRVVQIRGEYLPLIALYQILNLEPEVTDPEKGILVVVESNSGKVALFVDELIAQQQVVIKSLETHYRKVEGISGATIMGDGRVALILDIDKLARMSISHVSA
ncbi:chemotaxis protein CheW [Nitrincola schmidtii]|uniref:chemotaxis protein CheW n=1 Tax=Nitrincola schmidtii TaxID=1730894 RepID=UPI00124E2FA4|nr:chemotaxis protein CheW [Nitrincola schmidtii]